MSEDISPGFLPARKLVLVLSRLADRRLTLAEIYGESGFNVLEAENSSDAEQSLANISADLVVCDTSSLADAPFEFCVKASARQFPPLIIIAEEGNASEEIIALEVGADAFIYGPTNSRLLIAKSRALIRRTPAKGPLKTPAAFKSEKGWLLDPSLKSVTGPSGKTTVLTTIQIEVFSVFLESPGKLQTHQDLGVVIGGGGDKLRHVSSVIARLRRKLAEVCDDEPIRTVHGLGYVYKP